MFGECGEVLGMKESFCRLPGVRWGTGSGRVCLRLHIACIVVQTRNNRKNLFLEIVATPLSYR